MIELIPASVIAPTRHRNRSRMERDSEFQTPKSKPQSFLDFIDDFGVPPHAQRQRPLLSGQDNLTVIEDAPENIYGSDCPPCRERYHQISKQSRAVTLHDAPRHNAKV